MKQREGKFGVIPAIIVLILITWIVYGLGDNITENMLTKNKFFEIISNGQEYIF